MTSAPADKVTALNSRPMYGPRPPALSLQRKLAVLGVSPFVVGLIIPVPTSASRTAGYPREMAFVGSGITIECDENGDGTHSCIILTAASLFAETYTVPLDEIKVKVYNATGYLCDGAVYACDSHYNLAAVRIVSPIRLDTASLQEVDDVMPVTEAGQLRSGLLRPHQLLSPLKKIKIRPGDVVTAIGRKHSGHLTVTAGTFSAHYPELDCKELYSLELMHMADRGGAVINCDGDIIGIHVADSYFLPSNVVSRWWKYYTQHGKFCRPFLGVKVANYHAANCDFLEQFLLKFQHFSSGVFVSQVMASGSNLHSDDVISECGGEPVRSTLELFEKIWDKVGKSVEINFQRVDGDCGRLSVEVCDTPEHCLHQWRGLEWWPMPKSKTDASPKSATEASPKSRADTLCKRRKRVKSVEI